MKTVIATPTRGAFTAGYNIGFMSCNGLYHAWMPLTGQSDIYVARNVLANAFVQREFDSMIFIDSDIGFSRQNLIDLIESPQPLVAGFYGSKSADVEPLFRDLDGSAPKLSDIPPTGLREVKYLACGFMKIDRSVFLDIQKAGIVPSYGKGQFHQYFNGRVADDTLLSEDYSFCLTAADVGVKAYINCGICVEHDGRKLR